MAACSALSFLKLDLQREEGDSCNTLVFETREGLRMYNKKKSKNKLKDSFIWLSHTQSLLAVAVSEQTIKSFNLIK